MSGEPIELRVSHERLTMHEAVETAEMLVGEGWEVLGINLAGVDGRKWRVEARKTASEPESAPSEAPAPEWLLQERAELVRVLGDLCVASRRADSVVTSPGIYEPLEKALEQAIKTLRKLQP